MIWVFICSLVSLLGLSFAYYVFWQDGGRYVRIRTCGYLLPVYWFCVRRYGLPDCVDASEFQERQKTLGLSEMSKGEICG